MSVNVRKQLSLPWNDAVKCVPSLSEKECKDALLFLKKMTREDKRSVKDLTHRVYRRLNKLRVEREREELGL